MCGSLNKISNRVYIDKYGYYIYDSDENSQIWSFLPQEKCYTSNDLLDILNTLNNLNENEKDILPYCLDYPLYKDKDENIQKETN